MDGVPPGVPAEGVYGIKMFHPPPFLLSTVRSQPCSGPVSSTEDSTLISYFIRAAPYSTSWQGPLPPEWFLSRFQAI